MKMIIPMMRLAEVNKKKIWRVIDVAVERSLFTTIVTPHRTVDAAIYVDVVWTVLDRIPCNGDVKRFPGGVIYTGILVSEGVWVI